MRVSTKNLTEEWERANHHPFMYAGKGMGANVAAWKQAARVELASTATFRRDYAQALLDLVKAFDRIPRWLIVREAVELGFPLWFVKLSLETYKLTRVIRIQWYPTKCGRKEAALQEAGRPAPK